MTFLTKMLKTFCLKRAKRSFLTKFGVCNFYPLQNCTSRTVDNGNYVNYLEEMMKNTQKPEVIMRCVGERKEPSKVALDRFIAIYLDILQENQARYGKE